MWKWITYYSPELSGYLHSLIYHFIELKSKGHSVWPYGVLDCKSHIYLFLKEIILSFGNGLHLALMTCWYFTHFPGRFSSLLQYQLALSQKANVCIKSKSYTSNQSINWKNFNQYDVCEADISILSIVPLRVSKLCNV